MKTRPIHQNLSTSFINLPSLIRHLRELQFFGVIRVELASYEGELIFTGSAKLRAREHDRITGLISTGEPALVRILKRAREPFGRIHVYQAENKPGADVFVHPLILAAARGKIADRN